MTEGAMRIQKYKNLTLTTYENSDAVYHVISKGLTVMVGFKIVDDCAGRYLITCVDGVYMPFADKVLNMESDFLDPVNMEYVFSKKTFDTAFSWVLKRVVGYIIEEESSHGHG